MAEPHQRLNGLSEHDARVALARCCGATAWVDAMLARRPFPSTEALFEAADEVWASLARADHLEAFTHHPRIGEDLDALRAKFGSTAPWAQQEQAGVREADERTLLALRDENAAYHDRFGFLFIVCATGKSAHEMLELLRARMQNEPQRELTVAAGEQAKITRLRLEKLS